jgi:hypothetical protein
VGLAVAFTACTSPVAVSEQHPHQHSHDDGQASIHFAEPNGTFTKGRSVYLPLVIESKVSATVSIAVQVDGPTQINPTWDVSVQANTPTTVHVPAQLVKAGYTLVSVLATAPEWSETEATDLGFNTSSDQLTPLAVQAAQIGRSGVESAEEHIKNLPVITDNSLHVEQVKADLDKRDNVRSDYIQKNVKLKRSGGGFTTSRNEVVLYGFGKGSGKPLPGELTGEHIKKNSIQPQSFCGTRPATVNFKLNAPFVNKTYSLDGFHVRVIDDNGILSHYLIAEGDLDANGNFSYSQHICDPSGNIWDADRVDVYFVLEARVPTRNSQGYNEAMRTVTSAGYQYTYRTATNWNTTYTSFSHTLGLPSNTASADGSSYERIALWIAKMGKIANDFVYPHADEVPVAIHWPATFASEGNAYAPIARVILNGSLWMNTYPLIHEIGHNSKYLGSMDNYYSCLGSLAACAPGFAYLWDYSHSLYDLTATSAVGLNEGWAHTFDALTGEYVKTFKAENSGSFIAENIPDIQEYSSVNSHIKNCLNLPQSPYKNTCSDSTKLKGDRSEARVSTFLYQYTMRILTKGQLNSANIKRAYGVLYNNISDSGSWWGFTFEKLWNDYLYPSFPEDAPQIRNPCELDTNGNEKLASARVVLKCLLDKSTLDSTGLRMP